MGALLVCCYLDHAAVDGQGGADHVDVGRGGGALPLGQSAPCRGIGHGVVDGVRGGVAVQGTGWGGMNIRRRMRSNTQQHCNSNFIKPFSQGWGGCQVICLFVLFCSQPQKQKAFVLVSFRLLYTFEDSHLDHWLSQEDVSNNNMTSVYSGHYKCACAFHETKCNTLRNQHSYVTTEYTSAYVSKHYPSFYFWLVVG